MKDYKSEFIDFVLEAGALEMGERRLKRGRMSPYFFNAGKFNTGEALWNVGGYFADAIYDNFDAMDYRTIFGPAMKGIPLATSASVELYRKYGVNRGWCCDRQVPKDHGEGTIEDYQNNNMMGRRLEDGDGVLMVDDVITSGKTKYDALDKIKKAADVVVVGLMIMVDRCEVVDDKISAAQAFSDNTGIPVRSIVDAVDIYNYPKIPLDSRTKIGDYLGQYGTADAKERMGRCVA